MDTGVTDGIYALEQWKMLASCTGLCLLDVLDDFVKLLSVFVGQALTSPQHTVWGAGKPRHIHCHLTGSDHDSNPRKMFTATVAFP